MKSKSLLFFFLFVTVVSTFGQNNPVQNLTWSQTYVSPNNYFVLHWEEPAQPHGDLIGYNIYRNDELYRFQTETSLYNQYTDVFGYVSNCSPEFLLFHYPDHPEMTEFDIHVTAVYNPGQVESGYLETAHSYGAALQTTQFHSEKALLFPNPTTGLLHIGNLNLEKIIVYDVSGKAVKEFAPATQIDVSSLAKGIYIVKLFSEQQVIIKKIVVE